MTLQKFSDPKNQWINKGQFISLGEAKDLGYNCIAVKQGGIRRMRLIRF